MMPVELGKTSSKTQPSASPAARQESWQASSPAGPVAQLALPEFTSTARTLLPVAARCCLPMVSGAATSWFEVNIAAAIGGGVGDGERDVGLAAGLDAGDGRGPAKAEGECEGVAACHCSTLSSKRVLKLAEKIHQKVRCLLRLPLEKQVRPCYGLNFHLRLCMEDFIGAECRDKTILRRLEIEHGNGDLRQFGSNI